MEWFGGKPAGYIKLVNGSYQVIFPHGTKSFAGSKYGGLEKAKDAAEKWRYDESTRKGLTKNMVRVNENYGEPFLEVQFHTEDLTMKCDVEHIDLIEDSTWTVWNGIVRRRNSKKSGQSYVMFHVLAYPDYKTPKHLNGDGLDNRSFNVYDVSQSKPSTQSNNKSGIQGVGKSGNDWYAQIGVKGKRYKKTFTVSRYGEQEAYMLAVQQRKAWEQEFNPQNKDLSRKYKNFVSKLEKFNATVITTLEEYLSSVETEKYPELQIQCPNDHQFSMRVTSLYNKLASIKKNPECNVCAKCENPVGAVEEKSVRSACKRLGFTFYTYDIDTRMVTYKCKCGNKSNSYASNLTSIGRQAQCAKCQNEKFRVKTDDVQKKLAEYSCELIGEYVNTHTPIEYKCVCKATVKVRYCMFLAGKRCKLCGYGILCEHDIYMSKCAECSDSVCEHNKYYGDCKKCNRDTVCEHKGLYSKCIVCNPQLGCKHCQAQYVNKTSKFYPNCVRCHCFLNPKGYIPSRYKFKEHHLRDYLEETFPNMSPIFDKSLGACSLRRPDVFIECYTHTVIVECDENQHKGSNYTCENKRMMELFQDLGSRPIVFIRFNPDSYVKDGQKVGGCFKRDPQNILRVIRKEWKRRTKILKDTIEKHMENIPYKECTNVPLFYDD